MQVRSPAAQMRECSGLHIPHTHFPAQGASSSAQTGENPPPAGKNCRRTLPAVTGTAAVRPYTFSATRAATSVVSGAATLASGIMRKIVTAHWYFGK